MGNEQAPEKSQIDDVENDRVTLESQPESQDIHNEDAHQDAPTEETGGESSAELEALKEEINLLKEQALRAAAETQNIRRRAEQDIEKAHKFALERFVGDLLPVADNLERAIAAASAEGADIQAVVEGVELTLKTLLDTLKKHKVEAVDPQGEPFDPRRHQAMSMVPNADVEPNSVIEVFQKGYELNGRLVRPAMVVVSKAAE